MNDNNKLKDVFNEYQIKTSADDILMKLEKEVVVKSVKSYKANYLKIGFSFACLLIIAISFWALINKKPINPYEPVDKGGSQEKLAFQLFSGLEILDSYDGTNIKRTKSISFNEFVETVTVFNKYLNLVEQISDKEETFYIETQNGEYEGVLGNYPYMMELKNGAKFYYNIRFEEEDDEDEIEGKFKGEINNNGFVMKVEGEKEFNNSTKEMEIELEIEISEKMRLEISEEFENGEYSYSYVIIEDDEEVLEVELEREYKKNKIKVELEVIIKNKDYIFEIIDNIVKYEVLNYKGSFSIVEDEFSVTYKDSTGLSHNILK